MENKIIIFQHEIFGKIRTIMIHGVPWFVGRDAAEILGYSNASKAVIVHVDEEDKKVVMLPNSQNGNSVGKYILINESGLYSLILSSRLPGAKAFKKWITSEVLPAIRKTGGYVSNEELFTETYLPFADDSVKELFRLNLTVIRQLNEKIEHDRPLVDFAGHVNDSKNLIDMGAMAKLAKKENIKIGRNRLFRWLREKRIIFTLLLCTVLTGCADNYYDEPEIRTETAEETVSETMPETGEILTEAAENCSDLIFPETASLPEITEIQETVTVSEETELIMYEYEEEQEPEITSTS